MNKIVIGRIIAVLLVIITVFLGFATVAPSLDQTNKIFAFITHFFSAGSILLIVAIGRNVIGFALAWFKSEYKEVYEDSKLYTTLAYYVGLVPIVLAIDTAIPFAIAGVSIGEIIAFILVAVDIIKQAINIVFKKPE